MSLRPDDRSSRRRHSRSGTRERSRSRSHVRAPSPPSAVDEYAARPRTPQASPAVSTGTSRNVLTSPSYDVRDLPGGAERDAFRSSTPATPAQYLPPPNVPYPMDDGVRADGNYKHSDYAPPTARFPAWPEELDDDDLAYGDSNTVRPNRARHPSFSGASVPYPDEAVYNASTAAFNYTPQAAGRNEIVPSYSYQYAPPPNEISYTSVPQNGSPRVDYTRSPRPSEQISRKCSSENRGRSLGGAQNVELRPDEGMRDRKTWGSKDQWLSLDTKQSGLQAPPSPGLGSRMNRLSVTGDRPDLSAGGIPPASPLLEAYHGTYQSLSPMPTALRIEDDLSDLEPLTPISAQANRIRSSSRTTSTTTTTTKEKKRVVVYDAESDAQKIAKALNRPKVDPDPLIDILPGLSHDDIWALRKEYKKQVKTQGKGINLPKHLKLKLSGNFGKAVYVTALGRWESEGYWANFWYQAHGSRRELLIESLMGRSNLEIRNIKDEFRDKRYSDDLVLCMEKELKPDKFRSAVLMALEERRQEDQDVYPPEYRQRDVEVLRRALVARQGGESAMLEVVVRRSDLHLREVLRMYEKVYGENFARAALRKSNNLVVSFPFHHLAPRPKYLCPVLRDSC